MSYQISSFEDYDQLATNLTHFYNIPIDEIKLHRNMIGFVFLIRNQVHHYVFKIYRHFNTQQALQSIEILQYLQNKGYPAVRIVSSDKKETYIPLMISQKTCVGILYEYLEGKEPDIFKNIAVIGTQVKKLHELMAQYPHSLISRGKPFYIDRYIALLHDLSYDQEKIKALTNYGQEIWSFIEKLPKTFCHGDLHSGNMFQVSSTEFWLIDFDIAAHSYAIIDIATLCNRTDFNHLDTSTYDSTIEMIEHFYTGYRENPPSLEEVRGILSFIAVRHYELIATITECQGNQTISKEFLDQQYDWLMSWRQICQSKWDLNKERNKI